VARKTINLILAAGVAITLTTGVSAAAPRMADTDGPQWPNVPLPAPDPDPVASPQFFDGAKAQWPNVPPLDQARATIPAAAPIAPSETTGSVPARVVADRWAYATPKTFTVEGGFRYWYSTGRMNFGFYNGNPLYGDPTSTLDWTGLSGHTGEVFGRFDHLPSGMFVKGVAGMGKGNGGQIVDRDFLDGQVKFSDTTSDVHGNDISYLTIDLGWAYVPPQGGMRFGVFAGYQYWHERATAYGARCNPDDVDGAVCGPPGSIPVSFDTASLIYEPRWHALRLGVDWKVDVVSNWNVSGEVAFIPYAVLRNEDSHLLRQDPADLGTAPNIISTSRQGYGGTAEIFLNYAVTPNIEVGAGFRYWGLFASGGDVQFGPGFATDLPLRRFDQQRVGGLLQVKGQF
jgi:hypothetical protein